MTTKDIVKGYIKELMGDPEAFSVDNTVDAIEELYHPHSCLYTDHYCDLRSCSNCETWVKYSGLCPS